MKKNYNSIYEQRVLNIQCKITSYGVLNKIRIKRKNDAAHDKTLADSEWRMARSLPSHLWLLNSHADAQNRQNNKQFVLIAILLE